MAVTQTDLDNLNAAISKGVKQVTVNGRSYTYRTTEELIRARDDITRQLTAQTGARKKQTRLYHAGRGF